MSIILDGTTGLAGAATGALNGTLGATTPSTVAATTISGTDLTTTGNTILGNASTDTLNVGNGDLVKDASGNVNIAGLTASQAIFTNASKNLVSNAITGTGSVAMSTSPNINYANLYGASVYWTGVNGVTAASTGLNVNQLNGGRTILLLWSFSNGAGNNSASSIYMIRCGYDGDNYTATKIAGDSVGSAAGRDVPTFSLVSSVLHIAAASAGTARVGWIANT
jgi:hypothetical protein